jgi:hypothetical protein
MLECRRVMPASVMGFSAMFFCDFWRALSYVKTTKFAEPTLFFESAIRVTSAHFATRPLLVGFVSVGSASV